MSIGLNEFEMSQEEMNGAHDEWIACSEQWPPDGQIVETKIDDGKRVRNVQRLKVRGRLWWTPDGVVYVYYVPTHWRAVA